MLQEALQKLQKEIGDHPNEDYVRYVGAELIKYVRENPDQAGVIAAQGKTIIGSLEAMRKVAEKKKTGKMAMLTPDEGMRAVMDYYGIQQAEPEPEPVVVGFNVNLDDLL